MCDCVSVINAKLKKLNKNTVIDVPYQVSADMKDVPQRTQVVTAKADKATRKRSWRVASCAGD